MIRVTPMEAARPAVRNLASFASDRILRALFALALFAPGILISSSARAQLYGGDLSGRIFTINEVTGAGTQSLPGGAPLLDAMGYDWSAMQAWGAPGGIQQFFPISLTTGLQTGPPIAVNGGSRFIRAMEFVSGVCYVTVTTSTSPNEPTQLATLNTTTGALAFIGGTVNPPIRGLAWSPGAGVMYGISSLPGPPSQLYTVNLGTGAITPVGGVTGLSYFESLSFGQAGQLFAGRNGTHEIYTINETTGAATLVGTVGFVGAPVHAMTLFALPPSPSPSPNPTPTPSPTPFFDCNSNGFDDTYEVSPQTFTLRSGNGTPGGADSLITMLAGPIDSGFGSSFVPVDFAAADAGPAAFVVSPNGGWLAGLSAPPANDPIAQWISTSANGACCDGASALYAIDFYVDRPTIGSAEITLYFAVDNDLGNPSGTPNFGIYINGMPTGCTVPNGDLNFQSTFTCASIGPLLQPGANTLYVYGLDIGGPSGVIFSSSLTVYPSDGGVMGIPDDCEPSPTPAPTPTVSPDPTVSPTVTPSPDPSASPTPLPTSTAIPSPTASPTPCPPSGPPGFFLFQVLPGGFLSIDVALGDLDGDGDPDAYVNNFGGQPDKVWLNNGNGFFVDSGQNLLPGPQGSWSSKLGDLDGDMDLDVVISEENTHPAEGTEVWLNNGSGIFTDTNQEFSTLRGAHDIELGDFDLNGTLDVFIGNLTGSGPNPVADVVYLNNGAGVFSDSGQQLENPLGSGQSRTWGMDIGDLDGDGDLDAFTGGFSGTPSRVWINQGGAQLGTPGIFSPTAQTNMNGQNTYYVSLGDLDGDGDVDAYFANSALDTVWLNDGAGFFTAGPVVTAPAGNSFGGAILADVDGDNDLDAVICNIGPQQIFLNNGSAGFTNSGFALPSFTGRGIAVGDLDDDGDVDIFYGVEGPNQVWKNTIDPMCPPTPTPSPSPNPSPTASPYPTVTPTATYTPTPSPDPTATPSATETPTPSPNPSPTASPDPTATPSPNPSPTASPDPTATPSPDPSPTASPDPTATPSPDPSPTASPDPTATPSPDPSPTASPDPTATPSPDPSPTASPDPTATPSPDPSPTASPDPTATPSPNPSPTASPDPTATPSPDPSPTASPDPTATPSPNPSPTASPDPTATPSPEPSPTASPDPTATPSPNPSPTASPDPTATPSPNPSPTASPDPTATPSPNPSPTASPDPTATPSPYPSTTPTPTPPACLGQFGIIPISGAFQVPPNGSSGIGVGEVFINTITNELSYNIILFALQGAEASAGIHAPAAPGLTAPEVVSLPPGMVKSGTWIYPEVMEADLLAGLAYINIASTAYPAGELRGQIVFNMVEPCPQPTATPTPSPVPTASPDPTVTPTASSVPTVTPSPEATATPTAGPCCQGDANNSGSFVDAADFIAVQFNFGADNGVGGLGDANCSGSFVDAADFIAVQFNFGSDCG